MQLTLPYLLQRAREQLSAGQPDAASGYLEAALMRDPRNVPTMFELGRIALMQHRPEQALQFGRRILGLARVERPALGHLLVGNAQRARGAHGAAVTAYREALRYEPELTEAICNLGGSLLETQCWSEALTLLLAGVQKAPADSAMHANLGLALLQAGRRGEAMDALHRAVQIQPNLGKVWLVLGGIVLDFGRMPEAVHAFQQAARFLDTPSGVGVAQYNLALTYISLGRRAEALLLFAQALEKAPDLALAEGAMLYQAQCLCHWDLVDYLVPRVLQRVRSHPEMVVEPFSGLAMPQATMRDHHLMNAAYARRIFPPTDVQLVPRGHVWSDGRERLRVGFLCGEFRNHPTGLLMAGLLEALDRSRIEAVALTYGPEAMDVFRLRCLRACDYHVELNPSLSASIEGAARAIASLELDVLIDLTCYTSGTRSEVLRFRPAPVVGHYLAFWSTAASKVYDFTMLDPVMVGADEDVYFDEAVLRFEESAFPVLLPPAEAPVVSRATEGLPEDAFVFVSMNQSHKLSRPTFLNWCTILARVPGSVLWLLAMPVEAEASLRLVMREQGLDPVRLVVAARVNPESHAARLRLADFGLDTEPYGSHTTAMDLLCAHVPLVAIHGTTVPARVAASILRAAGLWDLVLETPEAGVEFAVRFATDGTFRAEIQRRVAEAFHPERSAARLAAQGAEFSRLICLAHARINSGDLN
jgi:protein O-GlcNAc transferase